MDSNSSAKTSSQTENGPTDPSPQPQDVKTKKYKIQFRRCEHVYTAKSHILDLKKHEVVLTQTDHGLEPCRILGYGPQFELPTEKSPVGKKDEVKSSGHKKTEKRRKPFREYQVERRVKQEEIDKYKRLIEREQEAFQLCLSLINKHRLHMKLIRVERFFNGSKIIFYFTADKRVDFRGLVKDLVQEFRTRVEMRQIGVRHETKMIGGLGCCGRDLCCSAYITDFAPVSIKMAKEQDLPLNPAKISGICNRLLCCLTYEYPLYKEMKKGMPKPGRSITLDGKPFKVVHRNVLRETILVIDPQDPKHPISLTRTEWQAAQNRQKKKSPSPGAGKQKHQSRSAKSRKK